MRNWESSSASTLESMVSITGYWNAYRLDIPTQWPREMAEGDDDDEQRAEATIDGTKSRQGSYVDWEFQQNYIV